METSSRCIVNININIRSNNSALVAPSSSNINIRSDSALIAPSSIATVFHLLHMAAAARADSLLGFGSASASASTSCVLLLTILF